MSEYPSTSRRISVAVTGRRSAIRYEISESCLISFSVSLAKPFPTLDATSLQQSPYPVTRRSLRQIEAIRGCADTELAVPMRLVLIEDHQALREGLELLLGREGCEVVGTAGTAAEGRELIERLEPDVSLVDIRLGDDSGIELTRDVLDADPERRVVLYTGSSDVELLISGLDSGARGYALKEGTPSELTGALETVAEGGTYVDPRLRPALLSRQTTQRMPSLSKREREIMDLLAQGLTGEDVAERLVLSSETVKTHIRNAMSKLEAHTRVHAVAIALREGYISGPDA
jgi:DNA-binding NarL/FixJ family response regulator